jgi:hypothetical protein
VSLIRSLLSVGITRHILQATELLAMSLKKQGKKSGLLLRLVVAVAISQVI